MQIKGTGNQQKNKIERSQKKLTIHYIFVPYYYWIKKEKGTQTRDNYIDNRSICMFIGYTMRMTFRLITIEDENITHTM